MSSRSNEKLAAQSRLEILARNDASGPAILATALSISNRRQAGGSVLGRLQAVSMSATVTLLSASATAGAALNDQAEASLLLAGLAVPAAATTAFLVSRLKGQVVADAVRLGTDRLEVQNLNRQMAFSNVALAVYRGEFETLISDVGLARGTAINLVHGRDVGVSNGPGIA